MPCLRQTVCCVIEIAALLISTAASSPAQSATVTLRFTVHKSAGVDKSLDSDDVAKILDRAAKYFTDEITRIGNGTSLPAVTFALNGSSLSPLPPLNPTVLRRYNQGAQDAIAYSRRTGLFGMQAVESLLAASNGPRLEISLVRKIVVGCPTNIQLGPTGQQVDDQDHYLGCSGVFGKAGIVRLVKSKPKSVKKYEQWVDSEGRLWAHEIGHIMGLHDIREPILPALPTLKSNEGWLMSPYHDLAAARLLGQECTVVTRYPNNMNERGQLEAYLLQAGQFTSSSSKEARRRPDAKNDCL